MSVTITNVEHPKQAGVMVEAVTVLTAEQLREVRDSEWIDRQMAIASFPSQPPVGFVGIMNPRFFGTQVHVGDTILKGPAGDFEVVPKAEWFE